MKYKEIWKPILNIIEDILNYFEIQPKYVKCFPYRCVVKKFMCVQPKYARSNFLTCPSMLGLDLFCCTQLRLFYLLGVLLHSSG